VTITTDPFFKWQTAELRQIIAGFNHTQSAFYSLIRSLKTRDVTEKEKTSSSPPTQTRRGPLEEKLGDRTHAVYRAVEVEIQ
jgi:hypothetical protein